ncbi:alpha/beta hydrolase [Streptomyces sp. NPDC048251]|uniref:Pimeloyl-ACP methyl ester carboxylesterase n=1 Tax=Streptomyces rishiriensis TaxID=68264 RepID=A0ABU0NGC8_STRRH|nr:alpha/beta hydrolase [Streptomyces rishiriensis]MDQ0578166.1 pimeloyl-ACP methyl ester carboxylesterase [Streptomyces rishiriensis]
MTDSKPVVQHRTTTINGVKVFYREAGDPAAPAVVLLHGFPASSHMFRNLIPELADRYHVIAPDHIGYGFSDAPPVDEFEYSFENLTTITLALIDQLGLQNFALYIQDYGAPIGLRIASRNPDRVTALLVQSGNAYMEGFTPFWDILFAHAKDRPANEAAVREYLTAEKTHWQYTHGVPADRLDRIAPDTWTLDQALMDRPGNKEIQLQMFWDYQFNLPGYPDFQEYFRKHQPPTLITWGKNDEIFGAAGARAYERDLPDAEIHLLDAGHFALESHGPEIAGLIRDFLGRVIV